MNDEQKALVEEFVKELNSKSIEELEITSNAFLFIRIIAEIVGIGMLALTMFFPTLMMMIAGAVIVFLAANVAVLTQTIGKHIKAIKLNKLAADK